MTLREGVDLGSRDGGCLTQLTHPPTYLPRLTFAVSRKGTWLLLPSSPSSSLACSRGRSSKNDLVIKDFLSSSSSVSSSFRLARSPDDDGITRPPAGRSHRRSDPGGRGYYEMWMTLWDLRDRRPCSQPPFDLGNCECSLPSSPPDAANEIPTSRSPFLFPRGPSRASA